METQNIDKLAARLEGLLDTALQFGIKLVIAVTILIIGMWIANKITKSLKKIMVAREVEPSLLSFLSSLVSVLLKILVVVIVLTTVGIEMTSIVAILGAASLAVGMALSGTLQNFAGGVVILLFKPFKVGDFIETQSGFSGTVLEIFIFTTRMKTIDNKIVYLPNGALSNGVITNFNQEGFRRADCTFGISYGDDVAKARELLMKMIEEDDRIHKDPVPVVYLSTLAASSVNIMARFWVDSFNLLQVQCDLNERVYNEFPKHGLSFPFPQMDVHLNNKN